MTRILLLLIALTLAASAQSSADETAIRNVVKRYVDARERIDPAATKALFTADADQLVSSGEWRKGLDAVVKGTTASSQNNSGKRTIALESIRFLSPDVAIADGRYELAGAEANTRKMWTTLILKRSANGWKIAAIRNMLPSGASPQPLRPATANPTAVQQP